MTIANPQVAAIERDILTSDLGEFCDCVMTEPVRVEIDTAVQGMCCSQSDDTEALLKFARIIRSAALSQVREEAQSISRMMTDPKRGQFHDFFQRHYR